MRTVLVNAGAITVGRGETAISFYTVSRIPEEGLPVFVLVLVLTMTHA